MTDDGLGVGVGVVRVGEHDAFIEEVTETTFAHLLQVAGGQIAPQLIHRDLQDQFGRRRGNVREFIGRMSRKFKNKTAGRSLPTGPENAIRMASIPAVLTGARLVLMLGTLREGGGGAVSVQKKAPQRGAF